MADLKAVSKEFSSAKTSPFEIKYSDVKIVDILVELEKDPKYGRSAARGARDFTSIIRNSMKSRLNRKTQNIKYFESTINELLSRKNTIEAKIVQFLAESGCTQESDFLACGSQNRLSNLSKIISEQQVVLDSFYEKLFSRNIEIKNNFLWRSKDKNYWLKVK